jgi:hypothetical protein
MTWSELGPLPLVASDAEGRRVPCPCSTAPVFWWLIGPAWPDGRVAVVPVQGDPQDQDRDLPVWRRFANALHGLADYVERSS